jgi:dihydrofolate synthase/folylpolyglutamate synthase
MPRFSQLSDWLAWLETLHPTAIDLGLSRVYRVATALHILLPSNKYSHSCSGGLSIPDSTVFMVAGTNGKGSCVSTIEQCLLAQGHVVGSYTSPHLHHYSERIRIDGEPVNDQLICDAFSAIDQARGDISLTYFEFGTLAALWIFVQKGIPWVLLEVGLGGRLDAVNIVDADTAIVTSIDVDHEEWLGNDRETIALEKLGVARTNIPVIIAEENLTHSLIDFAANHPSSYTIQRDFVVDACANTHWNWQSSITSASMHLPMPVLPLTSVAAGLQALYVSDALPSVEVLRDILPALQLAGRFQLASIQSRSIIFDVAHNPAAARVLAAKLSTAQPERHKTIAVFSVMADKAINDIVPVLGEVIDAWYHGPIHGNARSATAVMMSEALQKEGQTEYPFDDIVAAFTSALADSNEHDRIVVFGSFFTVECIQQLPRVKAVLA